jgi:hypothetical protein
MGRMSERHTPTEEPAHDVLAAEEFAVPAPDPSLHPQPVVLPDDPSGIAEPHDVLAAEEFAMPAARGSSGGMPRPSAAGWRGGALAGAVALVALRLLRPLRRR